LRRTWPTVVGYFMPGIGLPQLGLEPDQRRDLHAEGRRRTCSSWSGGIFHYVDGELSFTAVFGESAVYPLLRWRSTALGNTLKGLFFGHRPCHHQRCLHDSPGVLPSRPRRLLQPQPRLESSSWPVYLWHWVYGMNLGMIYNPPARDHGRHPP